MVRREQRRRAEPLDVVGDERRIRRARRRAGMASASPASHVREALAAGCPIQHREVIELAYFAGYSQSELAERLARSHRHRQEPHLRRHAGAARRARGGRRAPGGRVEHVDELICGAGRGRALRPTRRSAVALHVAECDQCRTPARARPRRWRPSLALRGAGRPPRRPSCATASSRPSRRWSRPRRPRSRPPSASRRASRAGWWPRFAAIAVPVHGRRGDRRCSSGTSRCETRRQLAAQGSLSQRPRRQASAASAASSRSRRRTADALRQRPPGARRQDLRGVGDPPARYAVPAGVFQGGGTIELDADASRAKPGDVIADHRSSRRAASQQPTTTPIADGTDRSSRAGQRARKANVAATHGGRGDDADTGGRRWAAAARAAAGLRAGSARARWRRASSARLTADVALCARAEQLVDLAYGPCGSRVLAMVDALAPAPALGHLAQAARAGVQHRLERAATCLAGQPPAGRRRSASWCGPPRAVLDAAPPSVARMQHTGHRLPRPCHRHQAAACSGTRIEVALDQEPRRSGRRWSPRPFGGCRSPSTAQARAGGRVSADAAHEDLVAAGRVAGRRITRDGGLVDHPHPGRARGARGLVGGAARGGLDLHGLGVAAEDRHAHAGGATRAGVPRILRVSSTIFFSSRKPSLEDVEVRQHVQRDRVRVDRRPGSPAGRPRCRAAPRPPGAGARDGLVGRDRTR